MSEMAGAANRGVKASVLIVDDDPDMVAVIREHLTPGYHTFTAADGAEAIEQFVLTRPDVVLLDLSMPRMDGLQAQREMRKLDPEAVIIVLRGGLVHDESKLKKSRIAVTWLSANTWAPGSIYGNVQFSFSWKQAAQKRVYWVEAMHSYRPPDLSNPPQRPRRAVQICAALRSKLRQRTATKAIRHLVLERRLHVGVPDRRGHPTRLLH